MEVYILDSLYRRDQVVDKFESLIWTERFAAYGDFELSIRSTLEARKQFTPGTWLAINESYRAMKVETVEDTTDDEGRQILTLKGGSLEKVLEDRIARNTLADLATTPKWILTDVPAAIARKIFQDICIDGVLDPADVIPGISTENIFPTDTIAEPTEIVTIELDPMTVYDALREVCTRYNMGFRLVRDIYTSQLYFNIYMGSDRTTSQSTLPAVIFSPDLENLQNTTSLTTTTLYKNVAYVFSKHGSEIVYPQDIDPTVTGFERHVLLVKVDDIPDEATALEAQQIMIRRGLEELSKHQVFSAFDGEISQRSAYKYGVHYHLGDMVELRNVDGATNNMQVTEQIFVSDREGDRSYPTLTINKFIMPGTWLAWDYNQVWLDLDNDSTTWAEQP